MVTNEIRDFLKSRVSLFQHFSDSRMTELLSGSKIISYEPNEAIIKFGEDASFLGVY
jgi:hypothetical protein